LDLEIALGGASAKVKPPNRLFRTGRKCVETSDDVIEGDFTITPDSRILDFRFIVSADEKPTAFLELESAIEGVGP